MAEGRTQKILALHHHMPNKDPRGRVLPAKAVGLACTPTLASSPGPDKQVGSGAGPRLTSVWGRGLGCPILHEFIMALRLAQRWGRTTRAPPPGGNCPLPREVGERREHSHVFLCLDTEWGFSPDHSPALTYWWSQLHFLQLSGTGRLGDRGRSLRALGLGPTGS